MPEDNHSHLPGAVGVDGYNLALPQGTGVATYARSLCRAIRSAGISLDLYYGVTVSPGSAPGIRETLFYSRMESDADGIQSKGFAALKKQLLLRFPHPFSRDMLDIPHQGHVIAPEFRLRVPPHDRLRTRKDLFRQSVSYFRRYGRFMPIRVSNPPAIMHWTYPVPITLHGARNVYTLHDLVPLRLPQTSLEDKRYYHDLIAHCIATGDGICTVSESSRRDICELFDIAPDRVANCYQPVDLPIDPVEEGELAHQLRRLFDLEAQGYFLFFGAIEPKKNLGRLIEAYLTADLEGPLVIVGAEGWRAANELRLLTGGHGKKLDAANNIRRIDYLPRHLLTRLIRGARAVLFPSLYEGFGLPPLEALALGAPLLTSDRSSLPEIVGDAAILVDPYDVNAIAAGLRRLDDDAELRATLSAKGVVQAQKFDDAAFQQHILDFYRATLAR